MVRRTLASLLLMMVLFAASGFAASPSFAEAICAAQVHNHAGTEGVTPDLQLPGQPPAPQNKQTNCWEFCHSAYGECLAGCPTAACRAACYLDLEDCWNNCS
jgi:hypothetical protein